MMTGSCALAAALSSGVRIGPAAAQEPRFFRIATGPVDSSYFAVGSLIGNVTSSPPGARDCERGGSCGVPGLIAVTQTTAGPLANIELIGSKRLEIRAVPGRHRLLGLPRHRDVPQAGRRL